MLIWQSWQKDECKWNKYSLGYCLRKKNMMGVPDWIIQWCQTDGDTLYETNAEGDRETLQIEKGHNRPLLL